jgi:hypothetical protein
MSIALKAQNYRHEVSRTLKWLSGRGSKMRSAKLRTLGVFLFTPFAFFLVGFFNLTKLQAKVENREIRVKPQGEASSYWAVSEAGFAEGFTGSGGYINVKNISNIPIRDAIFYAEYFDSQGRLCLTLVFSLHENDLINPGESRTIDSVGSGLFPSVEPEEMKLYLVQLGFPDQPNPLRKWHINVRAPATIEEAGASTLQLGSDITSRPEGLFDLMLVRVSVDASGQAKSIDVLNSSSPQIESWLRDFLTRQASLFPATTDGVPQESDELILVRVVLGDENEPDTYASPGRNAWVQSYVKTIKGDTIPLVTTLVFTRPPLRVKPMNSPSLIDRPASAQGLFELAVGSSYWSSPAVQWVVDASAPHNRRRRIGLSAQ